MLTAFAITWSLVTISPSVWKMTPVPALFSCTVTQPKNGPHRSTCDVVAMDHHGRLDACHHLRNGWQQRSAACGRLGGGRRVRRRRRGRGCQCRFSADTAGERCDGYGRHDCGVSHQPPEPARVLYAGARQPSQGHSHTQAGCPGIAGRQPTRKVTPERYSRPTGCRLDRGMSTMS